ncbi:MAG: hypothetical protein U9R79_01275 [Armatimonadota bacterium]|nr:hypothetical protein [Armatimonadota bacterium]
MSHSDSDARLKIGWSQTEITPPEPTLIAGQFHARVSEGVQDPITATVLALEQDDEHVVFVSCDLAVISDELREAVTERLEAERPRAQAIIMNATHTHTAPEIRYRRFGDGHTSAYAGVALDVMEIAEYVDFAAERIAAAIREAWHDRAEGSVAFGLGYAVVGRNRRWVDVDGRSTMYGDTDTPQFSHIEGYEDHSVNLLATYDAAHELTGVIVNVPCPSQVTEALFVISADYWHETRQELRGRLGENLFVLPQASAAGDQSPHPIYEKRAAERMLQLKGRSEREDIAHRIADAVEEVLGFLGGTLDASPGLHHELKTLAVPLRALTEDDVRAAEEEAAVWRQRYEAEMQTLEENPELRDEPRWYVDVTRCHRRMRWYQGVAERFELQQEDPRRSVEVHVVRLGDVAFGTNPFEYYLDFGTYIKARSPAVQTFLVQLAGAGTYVPSARSVAGGGYGSVPASTPIGPEGGRQVADVTIETIQEMWTDTR